MNYTAHRSRRRYAGAPASFAVILIIFLFTVWSHVQGNNALRTAVDEGSLRRRVVNSPFSIEGRKRDLEVKWNSHDLFKLADEIPPLQCRLVHTSEDKCDFVRANCPDEEAGIFSYLQLYYCSLPRAKPFAFVLLVVWLGLLFSTIGIAASDFFCINLGTIASILGMSESMAGVTFLAFGNGSPDVFSTFAAIKTHSGSLAVGELIGAAGFITAVVAGSMALVRPFKVARKSFIRDVGFFLVAAAFSMVFLADGHLHLWECAVMVGFYVFYVVTVFVWHWYLGQRRRRQEQEYAARGHFLIPESDEIEVEPYHDDDDDRRTGGGSRRPSRGVSAEDFAALERGNSPLVQAMNEADEETRGHWMAEISSNMRVSRPLRGERRNTANPIRPSLVGALEFRAVLSSLEKSRNIQTIPLDSRRFSDDPTYTTAQQQDHMSTYSNPEISYEFVDAHDAANDSIRPSVNDNGESVPTRVRAVSANDASGLHLSTNMFPPRDATRARSKERSTSSRSNGFGDFTTSPAPIDRSNTRSPASLLAPPTEATSTLSGNTHLEAGPNQPMVSSPLQFAQSQSSISIPRISLSRRSSGSQLSSPASPFPEYHDDPNFVPRSRAPSIRLPPPSIGSESTYLQRVDQDDEERPVAWWPYKALPPPQVLISTLFPTLYSWRDKSWWEKLLGIVSAPSVFLLAITLPVVESQADDEIPETSDLDPGLLSPEHARSRSQSVAVLSPDSPDSVSRDAIHRHEHGNLTSASDESRTLISPSIQINGDPANVPQPNGNDKPKLAPGRPSSAHIALPVQPEPTNSNASSPKEWNRWLVATQLFTAPLFIVVLIWANTDPGLKARNLVLPCLYALIASLVAFALLVVFTNARQPPKYRVANEVVGVLKALGVILGISDAILGLTVFAVGNSLGDLVADITVARLGFPVMALSACFGGPMLNILLGIGLSGLYMTIRDGHHKHDKHPDRPIHYKPYQIEISPTLVISGVTLVVTLLGLLLVVPLNKWVMDRKPSAGEDGQDSKKIRRSDRISSQNQTTPLKNKTFLPSPLTHQESTTTEGYKEATASPAEGRPSQINHRSPVSSPPLNTQGLSSPPSDTQPLSQFVYPPTALSLDVDDEEAEAVWGYLVPIDSVFGNTLVLRKRTACPAPYPANSFGQGSESRAKGCSNRNYNEEEKKYEDGKIEMGFPAGGYLIGRHPECDRVIELPTVSNRHCIVFSENKNGELVALIEDLSSNGTFVNEVILGRNKRQELEDGDQISVLDEARFSFRYPLSRQGNAFRQQYRILQQLGKGHFATVYLCVERSTGMQFAVKRFEKRHGDSQSKTDGLQQEIGVLKAISHPNVLCLQETYDEDDAVYLVLELALEGELFNTIVLKQKLTEEESRNVFIQLFQGIKYLHERNIVHRDIKPENILLSDKNLSVKLADFGLAKIIGEESFTTTLCGTPSYVAPEILENSRHRKYTRAVDVWSLGVVLYICLCGFPPFSDELESRENPYNLSQQIKLGRFDYPSPYWDSVGDPALDLIDRMLTVDIDKRITVDECLEHPWITQRGLNPADSTDGLTGAMGNLDFSKRKVVRERTLLSSINDVKVSRVVELEDHAVPVKVFEKNPDGKCMNGSQAAKRDAAKTNGHAVEQQEEKKKKEEEQPAEHRAAEVFMEMGGKGDQQLFADDGSSRYLPAEVPKKDGGGKKGR
ncbi:MAG: hypothetical protein L6R35_002010 [Caloplaca aegaea]|nr:MAG: hypothetical protein L6R35_002010 [Caloplaca aegaea]